MAGSTRRRSTTSDLPDDTSQESQVPTRSSKRLRVNRYQQSDSESASGQPEDDDGASQQSNSSTVEQEVIIKEILTKKQDDDGGWKYKVLWDDNAITWEPAINLRSAPLTLAKFESKWNAKYGNKSRQKFEDEEEAEESRDRSSSTSENEGESEGESATGTGDEEEDYVPNVRRSTRGSHTRNSKNKASKYVEDFDEDNMDEDFMEIDENDEVDKLPNRHRLTRRPSKTDAVELTAKSRPKSKGKSLKKGRKKSRLQESDQEEENDEIEVDMIEEEDDAGEARFQDIHHRFCSKCNRPAESKKRKRKKKSSDDELEPELGELVGCSFCPASWHPACLPAPPGKRSKGKLKDWYDSASRFRCPGCYEDDSCQICSKNAFGKTKDEMKSLEPVPPSENPETGEPDTNSLLPSTNPLDNMTYEPLFRCTRCTVLCHYDCASEQYLKVLNESVNSSALNTAVANRDDALHEITKKLLCVSCLQWDFEIEKILTFRPSATNPSQKEYLVKWANISYRNVDWVPERWISQVAGPKFRHYERSVETAVKQGAELPFPINVVIPKSYVTIDRILDIQYEDGTEYRKGKKYSQELMYYVKWKGLKYEESTWDYLPDTDAHDFKVAFAEWERAQEIDSLKTYKQRLKKLGRNGNPDNEKKVLLKNFDEFTEQPEILQNGTLRPHQLDGLNWLYYNWWKNIPCILADEMGLGKTIQTVSLLSVLHHNFQQFPFLVVAPNSTLDNWVREFNKWAPQLRVVMFSGGAKDRELIRDYEIFRPKSNTDAGGAKGLRCHVVIASYEMVWMDSCLKSVHHWDVLIVDEGHRLKNDASKLFDSLQQMNIKHRVLLTGTPLQNNVRELFNIMHFLDPLKFQNPEELASQYEDLDRDKLGELHEQLKPHFLRRVKSQVLRDLPPKAEIIVPVTMSPIQKGIYKDIISANCELLKALGGSSSTKSKQKNTSLQNIFLQLRKCLSHPYLIPGVEQDLKSAEEVKKRLIDSSGKLTLLHSMLPKLKARGHKVLIFSQFLETLDILEDYLTAEGYGYYRLDGSTSRVERQEKIDAFNAPKSEAFVFILSTRAGGVGVNLTSADTVIIYDVDWNPHQDLQAISRAHRIGQTRKVLAYKLMTRGSAEERMVQIGRKKLVLDHLIVQQMEKAELDEKDFESILKYGAQTLFEESDEKAQEFQKYDEAAIEALLDRSQAVEEPEQPEEADAAADAFGFEKVWKNDDMENLTVETEDKEKEMEGDENFWDNLVQQSLMKAKSQREEELGRGARRKARDVQYNFDMSSPPKTKKSKKDISRGASAENSDEDDVDQEYMPKVDDDSDDDDFIDGLARDEMDLESRNRRMLFDPLSRTEPYPENYQLTYSAASRPHLTEEVRDLLKESLQKLHSALEGMKSSATTLAAAFPKRSALGTVTQKYHCWLCNGTVYQKTDRHSAADCDILKMPDVLSERRRNFYARKEIDKVSWIDRQSLGPHHAANAVDIRQSILSNTSQNPSKPIYLKPNVNQHPSFNSANSKYGMANERQSQPSSRIIAGQSGCLVCRSVPFHPPSNCPLRHKPRELLARRREILRNPRSDPNETIFATLDFFLQQFGLYTQDDLDEHTLSNVDYGTYCPGCDNFGHFIHNCETRFHPGELRDSYETVKNTRRIPKYVKKELLAVLADYIRNPPPQY